MKKIFITIAGATLLFNCSPSNTTAENTKVESILPVKDGVFKIQTSDGKEHLTHHVLLATGRRGSPRKLECPGEELPKVFYRLLDSETITDRDILVVGGGDSAICSSIEG